MRFPSSPYKTRWFLQGDPGRRTVSIGGEGPLAEAYRSATPIASPRDLIVVSDAEMGCVSSSGRHMDSQEYLSRSTGRCSCGITRYRSCSRPCQRGHRRTIPLHRPPLSHQTVARFPRRRRRSMSPPTFVPTPDILYRARLRTLGGFLSGEVIVPHSSSRYTHQRDHSDIANRASQTTDFF